MTRDEASARRAIALLDLTNLDDACSEAAVEALCAKASTAHGPVAAVCVFPRFAGQCRKLLRGTGIKVAAVANFPAGGSDARRAAREVAEAVAAGAQEVDVVMPYHAFLAGEEGKAADLLSRCRQEVTGTRKLKVILETGELGSPERIAAASRLALEAGAHFIKTSTGKSRTGATPEAARTMLQTIRGCGPKPAFRAGFKASGGIRTLADARLYLDLADEVMGPGWASARTFRFGASGLLDDLLRVLDGAAAGAASPTGGY